MRKGNEKGAIVVEATIALTAFMFAIFTILSIVNICFIQAKISVALNTAAKEISQYSYLYYAFGADGFDAKLSSGTEGSKQLATDTIDGGGRSEGKEKEGLIKRKNAPAASAAGAFFGVATENVSQISLAIIDFFGISIYKEHEYLEGG